MSVTADATPLDNVTSDTLVPMLERALQEAAKETSARASEERLGAFHRRRSSAWVGALAKQFRLHYEVDPSIKVFSRENRDLRAAFGLNELLYDIAVCRVATTRAAIAKSDLDYVSGVLWTVESELARDSHHALKDFSKLVLSSANDKLFVASYVGPVDGYLRALAAPAAACGGNVYLCQIPHPSLWDDVQALRVSLFSWEGSWLPVQSAPDEGRQT